MRSQLARQNDGTIKDTGNKRKKSLERLAF